MPFYSGMSIICRDEAPAVPVGCKSNLEKSSFGGNKNSIPDPNAALLIGSENNFIRASQPLPTANTEGGENIFTIDSQPLPIADNEGGEYNFTIDAQPLPIAGGEYNFSRDTQLVPNADNEGGENNLTTDTQHLPNADIKGGENNSIRETQPLPNADNEAVFLTVRKGVSSGHQKRHQTKMPQALNEPKKPRKYNESMAVAMKHMANAVTSLTKKTKKEDSFSVDNVISVLQAIPDLDDDLILDAIDFLEDERRGRMFLALDANLRKKWLLRKLRS